MLVYYYAKSRRLTPLKKIIINFLKGVFALNARNSSQNQAKKGAYKKTLKAHLPYGMLPTKKWLREHELSAHAIDNAVKTETLLLLTSGVYSQYSRNLRWEGAVASLQRMELDDIDDEVTVPPTHPRRRCNGFGIIRLFTVLIYGEFTDYPSVFTKQVAYMAASYVVAIQV